MQTKALKILLIFWNLFIGLGAVGGACMMFNDTAGKTIYFDAFNFEPLLPLIQTLPLADVFFQDFLFPAIALLIVNGVTNLIAFVILLRNSYKGSIAGMACGIILMLWIGVQFVIFPPNGFSTTYFLFAVLQFLTAWLLWKGLKQSRT